MKKTIRVFLTILLLSAVWFNIPAQTRGGDLETAVGSNINVGKQWAVLIAIDKYLEWSPLKNPVKDAREIKNILLENYYIDEVRELYDSDATNNGIRQLLVGLRSQLGKNDSVFVFFAGHGHTDHETNTGFWIPSDGQDINKGQANWLPNGQIRNMISLLPAKHVFLVADSCFSGDILDINRSASPRIDSDYYRRAYALISRKVMTSGSSERVPDASEFIMRFKSSLIRAEGACIDPDYIFVSVREVKSTQPLLGVIRGSEHQEGGSFLFFRRSEKISVTDQPYVSNTPTASTPSPQLPKQGASADQAYFTGPWTAIVEYNNSFDTYQINLSANGRCTVKITNDDAEQETNGNWSYDGSTFKLSAVFRNAKISYQRNLQWVSIVTFTGDNNSFNILARPAANGSPARFTFFRD
ncbi:MAG: caspase family protein [Treponema sp.]|nr:caspase family protein [Treponema sp.]